MIQILTFQTYCFPKKNSPFDLLCVNETVLFIICVQSKPGTYLIWLHPKCVIYQNNMDSVFMSGISGDQELTADGIRGFAVKAFSGFLTWSFDIKSLRISCSCHISGTLHCTVKIRTDFVYTYNKDYFFGPWAMQDTRLELPSILTRTPSSVTALALDKKKSAS